MALKYIAILFAVLASCLASHPLGNGWEMGSHGPARGSGEQCGPKILRPHLEEPKESAAGLSIKRNGCTYKPGSRINFMLSQEGDQPIEELYLYARHDGDDSQHTVGSFKHCSWGSHLRTDNCIRKDDIIKQLEPFTGNVQVTWVAPEKKFEQKPIRIVAVINGVVVSSATILPEESQFLDDDSDESSSEESGSRRGKSRSRGGKSSKRRGGKSSKSGKGSRSREDGDDRPPPPDHGMPAPAPAPPHIYPGENPPGPPHHPHSGGDYPPHPPPHHGEHGWPAPAPVGPDGEPIDDGEKPHDHGGEDMSDNDELMEFMEAMYLRHTRWEEHNQEQNMCPETANYLKSGNAYWMEHDEDEEEEDDYQCWKMAVLIGIVILLMTVCGSVCYLAMRKRKMAKKAQEEKPKMAYDNDIYSLSPGNLTSDVKQPPVYTEVAEPMEKKVPLE